MTAKQRVLALKLLDKQKRYSDFAKKMGINVKVKELGKKDNK